MLVLFAGNNDQILEIEDALGLTDAIRLAWQTAGGAPLTAQDVRLRLEGRRFQTRRYDNLLASTTLSRAGHPESPTNAFVSTARFTVPAASRAKRRVRTTGLCPT
jgi:hypothetical protein